MLTQLYRVHRSTAARQAESLTSLTFFDALGAKRHLKIDFLFHLDESSSIGAREPLPESMQKGFPPLYSR